MAETLPAEKLRAYLQELTPEARALLLAELERGGDSVAGGNLILQELRRLVRNSPQQAPRINNPARLFFAPFEPFLVDDAEALPAGRIARSALDPVWQWLCRDLLPADAKVYAEELERAFGDEKNAARLVRSFQDLAAHCIQDALAASGQDDQVRRRLAAQAGTRRGIEDLRAVLGVLKARDALALIGARLPAHIRNLADEQLENVKALLDSPIARHPDIFPLALIVVMRRLTFPAQLIRLAVKAAESDVAQRIIATPAAAVSAVLGEISRRVTELRRDLNGGRIAAAGVGLKDIHDAVRALRTEMDLSGDSPWMRELAALRGSVSDLVKAEIEGIPGRVRRLLRPHLAKEIAPGAGLDAAEVTETEALVEFLHASRNYASELAINEVTLRVHSEIQNFLDSGTSLLLEALRNAGDSDRPFRLAQVDAAVRFAGKVFGPGYASLLAKAAEVAQNGDRKAAKA
jgi:hypothetical protein